MIRFACPGCSATFSVPDEKAGKHGKCPTCASEFAIPAADPSAPPPLPGAVDMPPLPDPPPSPADAVEVKPCPGCQGRLTVAPTHVGRDVECPYCKTVFRAARVVGPVPAAPLALPKLQRDEDDRPSRRRHTRDEDEDDNDDRPRLRRRRRGGSIRKPDKLNAAGGMMLAGGIIAILTALCMAAFSYGMCCLWPGTWYGFIVGILLIVRGANLLGSNPDYPPHGLAVCQIVLILNLDFINLVLGILAKVFLDDPDVKEYFGTVE